MNCIEAISQKKKCLKCGQLRINCVCFINHPQTGKIVPKDINLCEVFKKNKKVKNGSI